MRIAFVGKGGAGKTTVAALFGQYVKTRHKHVLAIDADLNIHLPRALGMQIPAPDLHLSHPAAGEVIKKILKGSSTRIQTLAHFKKSTPPSHGSRLILLDDIHDPILSEHSTQYDDMRLMVVGTYTEEDIGASCYHNDLAILENVLTHLVDDQGVVIADMVAGTDAFASTLHAQFDLTVLVVEPTWRGIEVYKDYVRLCQQAGYDDVLRVIGNKVKTAEDRTRLEAHIPKEKILGYIGYSSYLEAQEKAEGTIHFDELEEENRFVVRSAYEVLKMIPYDPQKRLQKMWKLHRLYVSQASIKDRFGDLTGQIDESFDIQRAAEVQRLCKMP